VGNFPTDLGYQMEEEQSQLDRSLPCSAGIEFRRITRPPYGPRKAAVPKELAPLTEHPRTAPAGPAYRKRQAGRSPR